MYQTDARNLPFCGAAYRLRPEWGDTRLCRLGRFPTPFCGERGALLHLEKSTFVQFYRRKVALSSHLVKQHPLLHKACLSRGGKIHAR